MRNDVQPAEQAQGDGRALVPAVNSACRILEALAETAGGGATLSELSRDLGLSKSSVHGLLRTLQRWGYVQRETESRRFRLGATLVSMGRAAASQVRPAALLAERLPVLAGEHHLTFAIAQVTEPRLAQVIDCAYPADAIHVGLTLGARYGPFDGAIGKCLLAAHEPSDAESFIYGSTIPRHTEHTIVDPDAFCGEIAQVRAAGWAASVGELKTNQAVAAPLFGATGRLELVLFAVGFPGELPTASIPKIGATLRETARAVEGALGVASQARGSATDVKHEMKEQM